MNLLVPAALLGLLTLPIIFILHLLRNRRKQVSIPSLRLWRGLEQKKQGSLPRNIPLTLMLLLQVLAAVALTLGLARPALSFVLSRPQHIIFVLDTTTSMTALGESAAGAQNRFDMARQIIRRRLESMSKADSFVLIGLNSRPEILMSGDGGQAVQALSALDNLVPGGVGLDLTAALTLANGVVKPEQQNEVIVVTDGNYQVESQELPPMLAPVTWTPVPPSPGDAANQCLLNVSARSLPDGRYRLFARVINYGEAPVRRTIRLFADDTLFDELTVQLEGGAETARVWTLPAQAEVGAVQIVEPDALPLDNRAEVLLRDTARQQVLLVSETPEIMTRALEAQPGLTLTVASPAELLGAATGLSESLADFDLTVWEGLPVDLATWPRGNTWVINPPLGHPLLPAQNYVRDLRPDPAANSPLTGGIDLSGVYFSRAPQLQAPAWAEVDLPALSPEGNTAALPPLMFHGATGSSRLVVWNFDLNESNLPARLALPLLTANTLSSLLSPSPPQVVSVGEPVTIAGNFSVETPTGQRLFLSPNEKSQASSFDRTKQPGIYRVFNEKDTLVAGFAVQAGSALESNLTSPVQFGSFNVQYVAEGQQANSETMLQEYWPWLIGLALFMITVEGWLAWRR